MIFSFTSRFFSMFWAIKPTKFHLSTHKTFVNGVPFRDDHFIEAFSGRNPTTMESMCCVVRFVK